MLGVVDLKSLPPSGGCNLSLAQKVGCLFDTVPCPKTFGVPPSRELDLGVVCLGLALFSLPKSVSWI